MASKVDSFQRNPLKKPRAYPTLLIKVSTEKMFQEQFYEEYYLSNYY